MEQNLNKLQCKRILEKRDCISEFEILTLLNCKKTVVKTPNFNEVDCKVSAVEIFVQRQIFLLVYLKCKYES